MTEQLKPCPFCGGPVQLEEANPARDDYMGERRWWGVVCRNTINRGGSCAIQQRPSASKEAATERWNRRAQPAPITSETGKAPAQGASAITSVPLLTVEEIQAAWVEHGLDDCAVEDFAKAIEQAVRAKLGVAVPMTDEQIDDALDGSWVDDAADFEAGIRAAEKFHGIVGKEGA